MITTEGDLRYVAQTQLCPTRGQRWVLTACFDENEWRLMECRTNTTLPGARAKNQSKKETGPGETPKDDIDELQVWINASDKYESTLLLPGPMQESPWDVLDPILQIELSSLSASNWAMVCKRSTTEFRLELHCCLLWGLNADKCRRRREGTLLKSGSERQWTSQIMGNSCTMPECVV